MVARNMYAKVRNKFIEVVTGSFGVPGVVDKGECLIESVKQEVWFKKKLMDTWQHENRDTRGVTESWIRSLRKDILDVSLLRGA